MLVTYFNKWSLWVIVTLRHSWTPPPPPPKRPSLTWTEAPSCPQTGRWPSLTAAGSVSWWSTWTEPLWCQTAPGTSSCRCPQSAIQTPSPQSPDQWRQDYRPHIANPAASELTESSLTGTRSGYLLRILADSMHRCSGGQKEKLIYDLHGNSCLFGGTDKRFPGSRGGLRPTETNISRTRLKVNLLFHLLQHQLLIWPQFLILIWIMNEQMIYGCHQLNLHVVDVVVSIVASQHYSGVRLGLNPRGFNTQINPQNSWNKTPNVHLKNFNIWQKKLVSVSAIPEIISLKIIINKFQ